MLFQRDLTITLGVIEHRGNRIDPFIGTGHCPYLIAVYVKEMRLHPACLFEHISPSYRLSEPPIHHRPNGTNNPRIRRHRHNSHHNIPRQNARRSFDW